MLSRIQSLGSCLMVLALLLLAGSAAGQDVTPRCGAAMDRAAGDYSRCLLRADAHYARHENASKLENRQARCATRFERRTSRAVSRHGTDACPSSDLVAAIGDLTASYAEDVATEADGLPTGSVLYVQSAIGGTLSETTLTLTGVGSETGWFTDRPSRYAGQIPTEQFLADWDEDQNSFADDPPNADFTCTSGGGAVNYVVELTNPVYEEGDLSYTVAGVGDTVLPQALQCESDSHLFIDGTDCDGAKRGDNYCACRENFQCKSNCCVKGALGPPPAWKWGCYPIYMIGPDYHPCVEEE